MGSRATEDRVFTKNLNAERSQSVPGWWLALRARSMERDAIRKRRPILYALAIAVSLHPMAGRRPARQPHL